MTPPPAPPPQGLHRDRLWGRFLAAEVEVLGDETRRTGRFLMAGAVLLILVATGLVRLEALPGLAVRVSGQALGIEEILVALEVGALLLYGLYLAGDIQRVLLRDYYERLSRVQLETEARLRRLEEGGLLRDHEEARVRERLDGMEARALPLRRRVELLREELEGLRSAGESGSRFTPFAAQRTVVEAELRRSLVSLQELEAEAGALGIPPEVDSPRDAGGGLPHRLALAREVEEELDRLEDYRRRITGSPLLRRSGRIRSLLEVGLAPVSAMVALILWGATR